MTQSLILSPPVVNHVGIIPEKLGLGKAPCPRLCFKVAEAKAAVLSNSLRPGHPRPPRSLHRKRCVLWYLSCPLPSTCLVHSHPRPFHRVAACPPPLCPWFPRVTLLLTSHTDQLLPPAPPLPTATFLGPQPYACPILQFSPGGPTTWML